MNQPPITVTYSLEEVLGQINQKLEKLTKIEVELAEIKIEVRSIKEDVKELQGASKTQIWTLIGILFTAVAGFVVAVGRFVISGNP